MNGDKIQYYMKEIQSRKGTPYHMANRELADEFYPYVRAEFPDAIMIKYGISQYIVVTKRARTALIKLLGGFKAKHENYIAEIDTAVNKLENKEVL